MSDDITKQIEEASKPLKPAFKEIVDSLAETNKQVALTAANFRSSNKDTFQGALAANKIRDSLNQVAEGLKTGEGKIGNIDFAEFKKVSETTQQLEEQLADAQKARAERLATAEKKENELGQKDIKIADLKEKQSRLQGQALNNATEELKQAEKEREEQKTRILAAKDREVKEAEVALEKEKKSRDNYNKELEGILKATTDESGKRLSEFSQGLKNLTGFDLMDSFDSVVKNINSVGMLFGNNDLFGDVVGGLQNLTAGLKSGISSISEGIMNGLKATGTYFSGLGETFKKGGLSAVTEQLNSDLGAVWNSMKEGAGNMMQGIKKGFNTGVENLKKGFAAFGKGAMNVLRGAGTFLMAAGTFVVGLLSAGASLVATGVSMLAAALGLSVPALLIGAIAIMLLVGAIYLYNESEGFRAVVDTVVGYFVGIIETIGGIFGGFYDFFAGLFSGDFDLMFSGLKDIFGGLWDLMMAPFRAIGDFFKSVFGIDIGKMLRGMAEKILPGWLVNRLFGEASDEEVPMETKTEKGGAMERGAQPNLTVEQIDELSAEKQVELGYANLTGYKEEAMTDREGNAILNEDGTEKMRQYATYESSDKYQDELREEGYSSGGFKGTASGSVAEDLLHAENMKQARGEGELIQEGTRAVKDGEKSAMNQAIVTTVNNAPTQMSNTTVKSAIPTPRDTDPTGSRLAAVPA